MIIKKSTIYNFFFYIIVLLSLFYIYSTDGIYSDFRVLFSNFIIITITLLFMAIGDRYVYSLNKIFMLFSFFFFGIAPAIQYQKGIVLWGGEIFSSNDYYKMNLLIIAILLLYQTLYYLFSKLNETYLENVLISISNRKNELKEKRVLYVTIFSLFIILYVHGFDFMNLVLRSIGRTIITNQSLEMIFSNFIRPMPAICLIIYKQWDAKNKLIEFILWVILLITNFPTSEARFYIATLYLPLIILYIKKISTRYLMLNKVIILGFLFIFPFLDQARRATSFKDFKYLLDFNMFTTGHFDSYQMFMRVVTENIITHGKQLLTSILFFVPRSIWPQKSIGSGALIAEMYKLDFSNVSMNYFGEGYINFGYIGIFIFIIILAYINSKYDKAFWIKLSKKSYFSTFYYLSLGLLFFLLRGSLLSGLAFATGMFVTNMIVNKICTR